MAALRQRALLALIIILIAGCRGSTQTPAESPGLPPPVELAAETGATRAPTATLAPPPPPVINIDSGDGTPTAAGGAPQAVSAGSLAPTVTPRPTDTPTPSPTPSPTLERATATPQPTFTPPVPLNNNDDDHYWLYRPVAEDAAAFWTDKTYPYGTTRSGTLRPHTGVEFYVPTGTPVLAAQAGTVVYAGRDDVTLLGLFGDFYGNVIVIEHDFTYREQPVYTLYAHLSEIYVTVGERVTAQEWIAASGATGVADGAHLHFEVRIGRNDYFSTRNPSLWIYPFDGYGTIAGRILWGDRSLVYEAPVSADRIDAPSPYRATTTYAIGEMNADDHWGENFVLDDIQAGYYVVTVQQGERKFTQEVWVYPGQTAFVEIVLEGGASE